MKPLSELKKVVEAATQKWKDEGEWFHDHRVGTPIHGHGENDENDAKFISTFNPTTVKALIERIEELEERTIPDDLTSYIQERVKAERERCADIALQYMKKAYDDASEVRHEILNPTEQSEIATTNSVSSESEASEKTVLVYERCGETFSKRVNEILAEGNWRVASSHAYPCDSDYFAVLIQRQPENEVSDD